MSEEQAAYQTKEPTAYILLQDWPVTLNGGGMMTMVKEGTIFRNKPGVDIYYSHGCMYNVTRHVAEDNPKWFKPQYDADSRPEIISNQRGI